LNVHADVVTRARLVDTLVVHLDSEDLASARVSGGVGRQEDDFVTRLNDTLLHTAGQHITHTLDLVGTGDRQAQRGVNLALRHRDEQVQGIQQGNNLDLLLVQV
ncbi:hypothetical protein Vafri_6238, partial [Volvox africanus]